VEVEVTVRVGMVVGLAKRRGEKRKREARKEGHLGLAVEVLRGARGAVLYTINVMLKKSSRTNFSEFKAHLATGVTFGVTVDICRGRRDMREQKKRSRYLKKQSLLLVVRAVLAVRKMGLRCCCELPLS
jgi:hypothetical protein